jgi:hypothetical protein
MVVTRNQRSLAVVIGRALRVRAVGTGNALFRTEVGSAGPELDFALDMRDVRLSELDLVATDARFSVELQAPSGPVQVRLSGARLRATLSVPEGTHVRILPNETWAVEPPVDHVRDGGPDDQRGTATSRYDVWLGGRGGRCRILRRPAELVPVQRPALSVLA